MGDLALQLMVALEEPARGGPGAALCEQGTRHVPPLAKRAPLGHWRVVAAYAPRNCDSAIDSPAWHDAGWTKCGIAQTDRGACFRFNAEGHDAANLSGDKDIHLQISGEADVRYRLISPPLAQQRNA